VQTIVILLDAERDLISLYVCIADHTKDGRPSFQLDLPQQAISSLASSILTKPKKGYHTRMPGGILNQFDKANSWNLRAATSYPGIAVLSGNSLITKLSTKMDTKLTHYPSLGEHPTLILHHTSPQDRGSGDRALQER
jgi:hypothetical protein